MSDCATCVNHGRQLLPIIFPPIFRHVPAFVGWFFLLATLRNWSRICLQSSFAFSKTPAADRRQRLAFAAAFSGANTDRRAEQRVSDAVPVFAAAAPCVGMRCDDKLCCLTEACSARWMDPRLCRLPLKCASWSLLCRQTGYNRQAITQVNAMLLFCAFACPSACLRSTQLTAETFLASIWSGDFEGKYHVSVGPGKSSSTRMP